MKFLRLFAICALIASPFVVTGSYGFLASRPQVVTIADASRPAELELRARGYEPRYSMGLVVTGSGTLRGLAEVALLGAGGRVAQQARLLDSAEFRLSEEWYEPEATLRYTPILAASGTITLRYRFGGAGVLRLALVFLVSTAVALLAARIMPGDSGGPNRRQLEARVAELRRRIAERDAGRGNSG